MDRLSQAFRNSQEFKDWLFHDVVWSKPGTAKESPMKTCWEVVRLDEQELTGPTFSPLTTLRRTTTQSPQHDILTPSLFCCTSVKCACYLVVELILWDSWAFALRAVWKEVQTLLGLRKAEKQTKRGSLSAVIGSQKAHVALICDLYKIMT